MCKSPEADKTMRDMEAAAETASRWRQLASEYRQAGFLILAAFCLENAKGAERWLVKAGEAYPCRCDSRGKPFGKGRAETVS